MSDSHEVKDANVEYFDDNFVEWRPLPQKTLLGYPESPKT